MRDLTAELSAITGPAHVLTDPALIASHATDWTRRYRGSASCVVRPGSTAEVAAVVAACAAQGVAIVPQGGNTGLVGGSVPAPAGPTQPLAGTGQQPARTGQQPTRTGQQPAGLWPPPPVILSTRRLVSLEPVDVAAAQVTAGAGVTIATLAAHAAGAGLSYGVDLASRDSATVGGTIATNAGGIRTIRYGPTRAQVAGLTAVLADGSVVSDLSGLTAGSAGYDLAQLLTGSEGTLAVITAARLILRPAEPAAAVLLAGVAGIEAAVGLYGELRASMPGLLAAEYFENDGLDLVCQAAGLPRPLAGSYPGYLLAEIAAAQNRVAGDGDGLEVERLAAAGLPPDTVIESAARGQAALWAYRERLAEAIATTGIPHKIDVAVPVSRLGAFRAELDQAVRSAVAGRARLIVFGHLGVGNLHVNVIGPDPADSSADETVARLAAAHGGSVAAEHGVGRAKTAWLTWSRPPAELAAMRAIKQALDPAALLNPGVLLPPDPLGGAVSRHGGPLLLHSTTAEAHRRSNHDSGGPPLS